MRKILNTILLLAIAIMPILPSNNAQAATTPQRYYRAYRSQLRGFLINYRGSTANKQGCLRTAQMPDGTTSDCLSNKKINDVMAQLDIDKYFSIVDPQKRRLYLMNSTRYPYVMKKDVMYFEQVLNPNTIVYGGANQTTNQQNYSKLDLVLGTAWKAVSLTGQALGQPSLGDSILISRVLNAKSVTFGGVTTTQYSVKPKTQILKKDLDFIYSDKTRMYQFAANNATATTPGKPDWTTDEINTLNIVVNIANQEYNYIKSHRKTPVMAKMLMDSNKTAGITLGIVGAEARGGSAIYSASKLAFRAQTLGIGSAQVTIDYDVLRRVFNLSSITTAQFNSQTGTYVGGMSKTANYMKNFAVGLDALYRQNKQWFVPQTDVNLAWVLNNRIFVTNPVVYTPVKSAAGLFLAGGDPLFGFGTNSIVVNEEFLVGDMAMEIATHEGAHLERSVQLVARGVANDYASYPALAEGFTDYNSRRALNLTGYKAGKGYSTGYPDLANVIYKLDDRIAVRKGWSIFQARAQLQYIQWNNPYTALDNIFGRGFASGLNQQMGGYQRVFGKMKTLAPNTPDYFQALKDTKQAEQDTINYINQW